MYDDQIEEIKRCVLLLLISERGWKLGGTVIIEFIIVRRRFLRTGDMTFFESVVEVTRAE